MDRRALRETAFKILFEYEFKGDENKDEFYDEALSILEINDEEYLRRVFYGVTDKKVELDFEIASTSKGWKLPRLSKVVLTVLRISVYEMTYMTDIPFAVSINEAVELVKKYDDSKAPKFVNGVLNNLAQAKGHKG